MKYIKLFFMLFLISFLSITNVVSVKSENLPDCKVVVTTNKQKVNPGEILTFNIFLNGGGSVKADYIHGQSDLSIKLTSLEIVMPGKKVQEAPLPEEEYLANFVLYPIEPKSTIGPYQNDTPHPESFNDTWSEFFYRINVSIDDDITPGTHEFTVSYVFQNNDSDWHVSSDRVQFYVNTLVEQYENELFLLGSVIIPIILTIIGAYIALYIHRESKEKKENNANDTNQKIDTKIDKYKKKPAPEKKNKTTNESKKTNK